jgi:hypothetical protein
MNRGGSFANTLFINKSHGLHVGAWRQKTGSEKPPCEQRQRPTLWARPLCATESSPLYLQTDLLAVYDLQPTKSRLHPNAAPRIKLRGLSSNVVRAIVSATRVYDSRCGRRAGMRSQTFISSMSPLRICQSLSDEQLCLTGTGVSMIC